MIKFIFGFIFLIVNLTQTSFSETGILFIAHGTMNHSDGGGHNHLNKEAMACHDTSHKPWEQYVLSTLNSIKGELPYKIEVAFGMWESHCYDEAILRLNSQMQSEGKVLDHILVFPLFISSASSVIEMQRFIFKQRPDRVLNIPSVHQTYFKGKITYMNAIDYNPVVSQILISRIERLKEIAMKNGESEVGAELVLVMHGPVEDDANLEWLKMGALYNQDIKGNIPSGITHVVSLRDDAPVEVRSAATRELRNIVSKAKEKGGIALILPLLIAKGGIEAGILKRLQGLEYIWTGETIFPDTRLKDMILARVLGQFNTP